MNLKLSNKTKLIAFIVILSIIFLLSDYFVPKEGDQSSDGNQASTKEPKKPENNGLKNFSKEDVARFTMSTVMERPSKTMKVKFENELYYVSYIREDDKKKFDYKIKINDKEIVWANIDGRWRDDELDGKIGFKELGDKLKITWRLSNEDSVIKEFNKGD